MSELPPALPTDGRMLRSVRTRDKVIDAMIALVEEGHLNPSVQEIAARAKVSDRAVFRHFDDTDKLQQAVVERHAERVRRAYQPPSASGPLAARLQAFVSSRADFYERITPVRRASLLQEPFSERIAAGIDTARRALRAETARVFAKELQALPAAERQDVQAALAAAASWSVWEHLRRHAGLSRPRAQRAVTRMLRGILA